MDIVFMKCSLEDDTASIVKLLSLGAEHNRVKNYICRYFDLPIEEIDKNNIAELEEAVTRIVRSEQACCAEITDEKIKAISTLWNNGKQEINRILCNIFECRQSDIIIKAYLSVNCVCPYNFAEKRIYINYRKSADEMLETCIHELIHYYWFEKWNKLFADKYDESLVRAFSEIAIDALFFETELKPYCVREYPAHKHFYDINYQGQNMIEYFRKLYRNNSITQFMKSGIEIVSDIKNNGII